MFHRGVLDRVAADRLPPQDVGLPGVVVPGRGGDDPAQRAARAPLEGTGAALAVIGSAAVQVAIFGTLSQRYYPIPYERRRLATLFALTAAAFAVGWVVSDPIGLSIAVKSLAIAAVPAILLLTGFFDPSETARVKRLLGRPA